MGVFGPDADVNAAETYHTFLICCRLEAAIYFPVFRDRVSTEYSLQIEIAGSSRQEEPLFLSSFTIDATTGLLSGVPGS